jgi:two-component system LytT family response regulator
MPQAEPLAPLPAPRPPPGGDDVGVVESVVDFLLAHLDDDQRESVVRRIAPPRSGPAPRGGAGPGTDPIPLRPLPRTRARIACLGARSIKLVPIADVELVRSSIAGVHAVTAAGEFFTEDTLAALEAETALVRCHKQYLVNLDRIDELDLAGDAGGSLRTRAGFTVPVSRRYRQHLREALHL